MLRRFTRVRAQVGVTLVEVIIALGVFSMLVVMALGISRFSTLSVAEKIHIGTLQVKSERTLKKLIECLSTSATLTVNTTVASTPYAQGAYASLSYYVPRDVDGSGTSIAAVPDGVTDVPAYMEANSVPDPRVLEYGLDPSVPEVSAQGVMIFRYEADRQVDEATEDLDLNGDNDKNDTFDIGRIRMEYYRATDNPATDQPHYITTIGDPNIVQRAGHANWGKPINTDTVGTNVSGRIFNLNGAVLEIRVWLMSVSKDRIAHLVQNESQVFLRNQ